MPIRHSIWVAGTRDFETVFPVRQIGEGFGHNFREACIEWFSRVPDPHFNAEELSVWQGKLYRTREEANANTPYPEATDGDT